MNHILLSIFLFPNTSFYPITLSFYSYYLLHNDRKSWYWRIKKQCCYERLRCASCQLCLWVVVRLGIAGRVGLHSCTFVCLHQAYILFSMDWKGLNPSCNTPWRHNVLYDMKCYSNFTGTKNLDISLRSCDRPWALHEFSYKK